MITLKELESTYTKYPCGVLEDILDEVALIRSSLPCGLLGFFYAPYRNSVTKSAIKIEQSVQFIAKIMHLEVVHPAGVRNFRSNTQDLEERCAYIEFLAISLRPALFSAGLRTEDEKSAYQQYGKIFLHLAVIAKDAKLNSQRIASYVRSYLKR